MRVLFQAAVAAIVVALTGCATRPAEPVALNPAAATTGRIGVAMAPIPKNEMSYPGAGCLLCLAAAAATNRTLATHVETLPQDDLGTVKNDLARVLAKKNKSVSVIDAPLNIKDLPSGNGSGPTAASKDFASLKKSLNVDKLLVVEIMSIGMQRNYASYIPSGAPMVVLTGAGYLVNLDTNTYEWYHPLKLTRAADGTWDEPPKFPGLTNAYYQVVEMSKDELIQPFAAP